MATPTSAASTNDDANAPFSGVIEFAAAATPPPLLDENDDSADATRFLRRRPPRLPEPWYTPSMSASRSRSSSCRRRCTCRTRRCSWIHRHGCCEIVRFCGEELDSAETLFVRSCCSSSPRCCRIFGHDPRFRLYPQHDNTVGSPTCMIGSPTRTIGSPT